MTDLSVNLHNTPKYNSEADYQMSCYAWLVSDAIPESLLYRPSFLLGSLYRRAIELETQQLAQLGIGVKQQAVLAVVTDEGPMTQQELGQRLGIDRTTIVTVVDDLQDVGLVERTRSPADRRAYLIALTQSGRTTQQRGRRLVHQAERRLLDALSEQGIHGLLTCFGDDHELGAPVRWATRALDEAMFRSGYWLQQLRSAAP